MQAVVLAAGQGKRLYPFTLKKPKPLIEMCNHSLLGHILDQLVGVVDEVVLIVGYLHEMIEAAFGHEYKNIKITYVLQREQLGTGHAVLQAQKYISDSFLVLNGDDLLESKDIQLVAAQQASILVAHRADPRAFGQVIIEGTHVNAIKEKQEQIESLWINTGMYKLPYSVFANLAALRPSIRGEYELTDAVVSTKLVAVKTMAWQPVGYPWHILDVTQQRCPEGIVGKSVIKNCSLDGCVVVGDGCELYDCQLSNVVIGNNTTLRNCHLHDSVLGDDVVMDSVVLQEQGNYEVRGQKTYVAPYAVGIFVGDGMKVVGPVDEGTCFP